MEDTKDTLLKLRKTWKEPLLVYRNLNYIDFISQFDLKLIDYAEREGAKDYENFETTHIEVEFIKKILSLLSSRFYAFHRLNDYLGSKKDLPETVGKAMWAEAQSH